MYLWDVIRKKKYVSYRYSFLSVVNIIVVVFVPKIARPSFAPLLSGDDVFFLIDDVDDNSWPVISFFITQCVDQKMG